MPPKITNKRYRCKRCGFVKEMQTNHYGSCWSWGHVNTCPNCPPWAKYPEYGSSTLWVCLEEPVSPLQTLKTASGKKVYKSSWEDMSDGDTVYLFARCQGMPYAVGPFRVVNNKKRILCRLNSKKEFKHYPEELYTKNPYHPFTLKHSPKSPMTQEEMIKQTEHVANTLR